jgi:hypothetical protein
VEWGALATTNPLPITGFPSGTRFWQVIGTF